jgi:hypothetical protein
MGIRHISVFAFILYFFVQPVCANPKLRSSIRMATCTLRGDKHSVPLSFIFDVKTGRIYRYDQFIEKLVPSDGLGDSDVLRRNHVRTAIVGDLWKWRHELGSSVLVERTVNIKSLDYKEVRVNSYGFKSLQGFCRWESPPTLEVQSL